jgi:hypothetical protein
MFAGSICTSTEKVAVGTFSDITRLLVALVSAVEIAIASGCSVDAKALHQRCKPH